MYYLTYVGSLWDTTTIRALQFTLIPSVEVSIDVVIGAM